MTSVYNYSFEISGALLLLVILIFLRVQYTEQTPSSIAFRRFVLMMLTAEVLDVSSSILHNHITLVGVTACLLADTAYFAASALVEYVLAGYIRTRVKPSPLTSFLNAVDGTVVVLFLLLIVLNSLTGWVFWFDGDTYMHGSAYAVVYLVPTYYLFSSLVRILANTAIFLRKELMSYFGFVAVMLASMVLQGFALPSTLLVYFGGSIGALILLFGLETPDYPKLIETMEELEYLQRNLENEVKKQTALAVERKDQVERMSVDTVRALATAIDAKDEYTRGHSSRVAWYSRLLALQIGWDEEQVEDLYQAALLHDIGKIGIPDSILNKPSRLEDAEYEVIQTHTIVGASILERVPSVPEAMAVARSHHERFDGSGYPEGLAGEEIPLSARVVAIADAFDAMSSHRVYRRSLSREEIGAQLQKGRGTQFDPELLDAFMTLYRSGALDEVASIQEEKSVSHRVIAGNYMKARSNASEDGARDYISGLPMRFAAERAIGEMMAVCPGWMILVDLDNLGQINDQSGHEAGDRAIKQVADRLASLFEDGVVSRIGGDEFLCFVSEISQSELESRISQLAFHDDPQSHDTCPSLSVGICDSKRKDAFGLIFSRADKALYHAKRSGKAKCCLYQINGTETANGDLSLKVVSGTEKSRGDSLAQPRASQMNDTLEIQNALHMLEGVSGEATVLMITLRESKGQILFIDEIEQAMTCMAIAIGDSVRAADISVRYGGVQYLVALVGASREDASAAADRIFKSFFRTYDSNLMQPSYSVVDMSQLCDAQ